MPEGPEVQGVVNSLIDRILNKKVVHVDILHHKITMPMKKIGRQEGFLFTERVQGTCIKHLERRGKYLVFHCEGDGGLVYMISHLGMTGAFFAVQSMEEIAPKYRKHVHIILELDDGILLAYSDQRRFGWMGALDSIEYLEYHPIQKIGPDPLITEESDLFIANMRKKTSAHQPIKRSIMRPEVIAGVGNIYACESLFHAKIHPMTPAVVLSDDALVNLYDCIRYTLAAALEQGGSTVSDYVDAKGQKGSFQDYHHVYKKIHCPVCVEILENVRIDTRSSFYCPSCQPQEESIKRIDYASG